MNEVEAVDRNSHNSGSSVLARVLTEIERKLFSRQEHEYHLVAGMMQGIILVLVYFSKIRDNYGTDGLINSCTDDIDVWPSVWKLLLRIILVRSALIGAIATGIQLMGESWFKFCQSYLKCYGESFIIGFTSVNLFALVLSPSIMTCADDWQVYDLIYFWDYTIFSHILVTFFFNYIFCYMRSIHDESVRAEKFIGSLVEFKFEKDKEQAGSCAICLEDYEDQ